MKGFSGDDSWWILRCLRIKGMHIGVLSSTKRGAMVKILKCEDGGGGFAGASYIGIDDDGAMVRLRGRRGARSGKVLRTYGVHTAKKATTGTRRDKT